MYTAQSQKTHCMRKGNKELTTTLKCWGGGEGQDGGIGADWKIVQFEPDLVCCT